MLLVFRTVGLKETAHLDDDGVIAVSFDLQADDEMEQRSSERRRARDQSAAARGPSLKPATRGAVSPSDQDLWPYVHRGNTIIIKA